MLTIFSVNNIQCLCILNQMYKIFAYINVSLASVGRDTHIIGRGWGSNLGHHTSPQLIV